MATGRSLRISRSHHTPRRHIVDTPETRVHRMADLIGLLGVALGIVVVLLLGAYAHGTTEGITTDVQGVSAILQRLLVAPVNLFSGIVTLVLARRGHHRPGDTPGAAPHP